MDRIPKLIVSLLIDAIGFFTIGPGDWVDLLWAPASALAVGWLYRRDGYTFLAFGEEILPGTDFIPTATLAWLDENGYLGIFKKKK